MEIARKLGEQEPEEEGTENTNEVEPSESITQCIGEFLGCLEKSGDKLSTRAKKCYQLFQDCSGSVILIPDVWTTTTTKKCILLQYRNWPQKQKYHLFLVFRCNKSLMVKYPHLYNQTMDGKSNRSYISKTPPIKIIEFSSIVFSICSMYPKTNWIWGYILQYITVFEISTKCLGNPLKNSENLSWISCPIFCERSE